MHPAALWKPLADGRVLCRLCSHFCRIENGGRGRCGVRTNKDGALFSLVYDQVAAINLDPVEKKPLYHFLPGTRTFSFGTMGARDRTHRVHSNTLHSSACSCGNPLHQHTHTVVGKQGTWGIGCTCFAF